MGSYWMKSRKARQFRIRNGKPVNDEWSPHTLDSGPHLTGVEFASVANVGFNWIHQLELPVVSAVAREERNVPGAINSETQL